MAAPDGDALVDAMARAGSTPTARPMRRTPAGAVASYVELHIEQGPRLEEAGIPIGVVEAIVGVRRSRVVFVARPITPARRRWSGGATRFWPGPTTPCARASTS